MALKKDRNLQDTAVEYFMNEVAARGGVVSVSTGGSGAALDSSVNLVTYAANPSGRVPVGFLLCDMVNKDLTQTHLNYFKEEVQRGGKVTLCRKGWVVTDFIYPGISPTAGQTAFLGHSGFLHNSQVIAQWPAVGRFDTSKDEEGYCKVSINLP